MLFRCMMVASGCCRDTRAVKPTGIVDLMTIAASGFTASTSAMTDSTVEVSK